MKISILIPVFNEAQSIQQVIQHIPSQNVTHIIICNNNSTDDTANLARNAGAIVVDEPRKGYGYACLKGMEYLINLPVAEQPDIVAFLDGDFSDYPEQLFLLTEPIAQGDFDMVIGSRVQRAAKGALTPQQRFGNWLATRLLYYIYSVRFSDLGPFRAIGWQQLLDLDMQDKTFGWTVEMQVKAAKKKLRTLEVAVDYRPRIGVSKVSGTVYGSVMAGYKILWTIFVYSRFAKIF